MPALKETLTIAKSSTAFAEATAVLVGGVNSPVRAFSAVGGKPMFIQSAEGCRITDADGQTYVDYVGSWGPMIVGHADARVKAAVSKALTRGSSFGAPNVLETALAQQIVTAVPSVEKVRFVNSGTEAAMTALRLARAATGREKIVKCAGCYHGHVDSLLVQAGSGATTLGTPSSPGIPQSVAADTLLVNFNDLDATQALFEQYGDQIAAMIVEPVAGNMGVIPPAEAYLQGLRSICSQHGALLVFDEVMTGFRVGHGGAQQFYGVRPDITTLGKVIGGGLPVGAVGGGAALMDMLAPIGPVYQAGTLSGNPLAMAAGKATLDILAKPETYKRLEAASQRLSAGLRDAADAAGVPTFHSRVGSMLCTFFTDQQVDNYTDALTCNTERFARYFHAMLKRGVYLAPSQFEAMFVSLAHDDQALEATLGAACESFMEIKD